MEFKIEKANDQDAENINALVNSGYRGEFSKQGWTTEADLLDGGRSDVSLILDILKRPGSMIMKYVENGVILGCMELRNEGEKLYLGMLTVRPNLQGKGIGKALLKFGEEEAIRQNCSFIRMMVISRRTELVDWYLRHGYLKQGTKPFDINDPRFGQPKSKLEFLILEKKLS